MKIGIDFGTTRIVVAAADRGNYPLVNFESSDGNFKDWFPSVMAISDAGRVYGWQALEMQGKWDEAQHEYENMIQKEPNSPGPHFLLGRAFLSRPDADAKMTDRAKQEFQKEIEIDPKNPAIVLTVHGAGYRYE